MDEEIALTLDGVNFTERELRAIALAKHYRALGEFGAPDHMFLVLITKLTSLIDSKGKYSFRSDFWSSTD
jgi:hypothetical protein